MDKKIAMLFAEGFEEAEAVIVADVLRRLEFDLELVGIDGEPTVTGSHRIGIVMDRELKRCRASEFDAVVLPGGMAGAQRLRDSDAVIEFIREVHAGGGVVGAICAAPIVLAKAGLLENCRFTAYPGLESEFGARKPTGSLTERGDRVVTGRGPGASFAFAAELAAALNRGEAADDLFEAMLVLR